MIAKNVGYNQVEVRWLEDRRASDYRLYRLRFGDACTDLRVAEREEASAPAEITVQSDRA